MKRVIVGLLLLALLLNNFATSVYAASYVNGFNDGKAAGYEQGHEAGYTAGYNDRDREVQNEIMIIIGKTVAFVAVVAVVVGIPVTSGITSYFVNRKRDKVERELRSQNDALKFDLMQWQNRALLGIQPKEHNDKSGNE